MNIKKNWGIVVLIVGLICLGLSFFIKNEVAKGMGEISSAQRKVDQGNGLFSVTPATKGIGNLFTGSAQKKINEGISKVNQYNNLADWLQIGGVVFLLAGLGVVVFGKKTAS
jgi:hypothetical protein